MNVSASLAALNEEEAGLYVGGFVLVLLLTVVGVLGNVHVLLVYKLAMKPSNHRIFILCLAILDTITCTIGMPFVLINFRKPYTFHETALCKTLTFNNFFICLSSAAVLIVIAIDRYRKICVPMGKQMSRLTAKVTCFVAMVIALLFSWPALVLYGSTLVETRVAGVTGWECNVLDEYKHTSWPLYFNGVLLLVSLSCFIVLVVLYTFIGRVIWAHRTFRNKMEVTNTEETHVKTDKHDFKAEANFHSGSTDSNEFSDRSPDEPSTTESSNFDRTSRDQIIRARTFSFDEKSSQQRSLRRSMRKFDRTKKTTMMLFWITVVFFFSYVPYLTLRIATFSNEDWYPSMSRGGKITFNTLLWCVFINNMANSVIYGFCDMRFRQQVKRGYRKLCCRGRACT